MAFLRYRRSGSFQVRPPSDEHPNGVWYHDPYERPEQPHHVHRVADDDGQPINCSDHSAATCTPDHWIGGRPERDHPHHVEIDCSTGLVGYTRLTEEEVADLELVWAYERELIDKVEAEVKARHDIIRGRVREDPAFKAIAELLGIKLD